MNDIEQEILKQIKIQHQQDTNWEQKWELEKLIDALSSKTFCSTSPDFIKSSALSQYVEKSYNTKLKLWYQVELYFATSDSSALEILLIKERESYNRTKSLGGGLPSKELHSPKLIRSIYLSKDERLISLFKKYLPAPKAELFQDEMPEGIRQKALERDKSIQGILKRNDISVDELTNKVLPLQRLFRSRLRKKEELLRIESKYKNYIKWKRTSAEQIVNDINKPYIPKCADRNLARRIMIAAQQVELFTTVKHLTSKAAIVSIFNDALYGQRTLLQLFLPFKPASLMQCDIDDGDANVICMGPNEIDPKAEHSNTITLVFDSKKLASKNPTTFFKQRDLGYGKERTREVLIFEDETLYFSHTEQLRCQAYGYASLQLRANNQPYSGYAVAEIPNVFLLSYNLDSMHQILALNFFRFLDNLTNTDREEFKEETNRIYDAISELSDEDLVDFLQDMGEQLTDTAEFNFYGAHRIDFSNLLSISFKNTTLKLDEFINELNSGNVEALNDAVKAIPEIFKSYRFLDYLLAKTTSETNVNELTKMRATCILPSWFTKKEDSESVIDHESSANGSVACTLF